MKKRLDMMLVERALAPSREKAKAYIMAGQVYVDGQKEDKAGSMFTETVKVEVRGNTLPYVSRGGLKLEKAMNEFDVSLEGKVCMDVGASTGGFLLTEDGEIVCLIKPQFEAGREKVGKKGVVRDPAVHEEVIEKVRDFAMSISLEPCHLSFSPIKGPEGNIEYLLHLKKRPEGTEVPDSLTVKVEDVVAQAHGALDKPAEK